MNSAADRYADAEQRERAEKKRITNGDKVREALSKLSDYKIAHQIDFCGLYDECDECPINGMENCNDTARAIQFWLEQEANGNDGAG